MLEIKSRRVGKVQVNRWMVILTSSLVGGVTLPAAAQNLPFQPSPSQASIQTEQAKIQQVTNLDRLSQQNRPATTVEEWVAQIEAATVQVTSVSLNRTDDGLEIVLQTAEGKPLPIDAAKFRSEGNSLIADIPNAVLALPDVTEFAVDNPTDDVASVRVVQQDATNIRISVSGNKDLPLLEVTLKAGESAYILNPDAEEELDEEVVVTGERDSYRVPNATTATKTDAPIRNIPQSIQVIPRQVLRDQAGTQISDALRNVSSLTNGNIPGSFGDSGTSRGFPSGRNYFINGISSPFAGQNIDLETFNLEQIEVLKGPGSVLYGRGEPGAVINVVTKQPLPNPTYQIGFDIGNFNYYRSTLDLSGPLNVAKTARYRFNLLYQNTDSFVDSLNFETFAVAPVFSFDLSKNTKFTLEGQYFRYSEAPYFTGLPASGTLFANPVGKVRLSRNLGDPESNAEPQNPSTYTSIGYRLEHKFSDRWSLRNAFNFESYNSSYTYLFIDGLDATDNRTLNRSAYRVDPGDALSQNFVLQTDMIGKFQSGSLKQEVLFGFELRRRTIKGVFQFAPAPPTDLFDPTYGIDIPDELFTVYNDSFSKQSTLGMYLQDLISVGENLHILLGIRLDAIDQRDENKLTGETFKQEDLALSPRFGIVYQPIREISLYANYSQSFEPSENSSSLQRKFTPPF